MQGLLGNPVLQGLLSGGGPMGVRAQSQQQLAQMTPRASGGMMGAPSAPAPFRAGAQAIESLGDSAAKAIGGYFKRQEAEETLEANKKMVREYIATLPEGEQRDRLMGMTDTTTGLEMVMGVVKDLLKPSTADYVNVVNTETGETRTIAKGTQPPPGFVMAGAASMDGGASDKIKLFYGDESVEVTPGSLTEKYYREAGFTSTPARGGGGSGFDDLGDRFDSEKDLRTEVNNLNKGFQPIVANFERIQNVVDNPSPGGDIALVFSYMKMLDPNSTVREGEAATAREAGGVPQRILATYNNLVDGNAFTQKQREDFYNVARAFYDSEANRYNANYQYLTEVARDYELNPSNIGRNIFSPPSRTGAETVSSGNGPPPPLLSGSDPNQQSGTSIAGAPVPRFESTDDPAWQRFSKMSPQGRVKFLQSLPGNDPLQYLFTLEEQEGPEAVDEIERIMRQGRSQ